MLPKKIYGYIYESARLPYNWNLVKWKWICVNRTQYWTIHSNWTCYNKCLQFKGVIPKTGWIHLLSPFLSPRFSGSIFFYNNILVLSTSLVRLLLLFFMLNGLGLTIRMQRDVVCLALCWVCVSQRIRKNNRIGFVYRSIINWVVLLGARKFVYRVYFISILISIWFYLRQPSNFYFCLDLNILKSAVLSLWVLPNFHFNWFKTNFN